MIYYLISVAGAGNFPCPPRVLTLWDSLLPTRLAYILHPLHPHYPLQPGLLNMKPAIQLHPAVCVTKRSSPSACAYVTILLQESSRLTCVFFFMRSDWCYNGRGRAFMLYIFSLMRTRRPGDHLISRHFPA